MKQSVFKVSQVNKYIKSLFEDDFILQSLFVEGEISNYSKHSSGHIYFTLKDETASINCVMFKSFAQNLKFEPKNGLNCIVFGKISLYEKSGQYQLYCELMEPKGVGDLYIAFEQLKNKLSKEGLFLQKYKKQIPKICRVVAFISSPTGAVVRDVINVAKRRDKSVNIVVVPTIVQGEEAAQSISRAIKLVNKWGKADVIILGRGGGSIEDLWAFNEEIVARAIFNSQIPVISAVGHETDFTISDFVADLRAPTPSAAAEIAVYNKEEIIDFIYTAKERMKQIVYSHFEIKEDLLNYKKILKKELYIKLESNKVKFLNAIGNLQNLSPLEVIKRGFSVTYDENDKVLQKTDVIKKGDKIKTKMQDGFIKSEVYEIVVEENGD